MCFNVISDANLIWIKNLGNEIIDFDLKNSLSFPKQAPNVLLSNRDQFFLQRWLCLFWGSLFLTHLMIANPFFAFLLLAQESQQWMKLCQKTIFRWLRQYRKQNMNDANNRLNYNLKNLFKRKNIVFNLWAYHRCTLQERHNYLILQNID